MRKFFKGLVAALALTTLVGSAFAADTIKGSELKADNPWGSGGSSNYEIDVTGIDVKTIDKVVVKTSNDCGYHKGIIGYTEDNGTEKGKWTTTAEIEVSGNEGEFVLEGLDGKIMGGLQVQFWWINSIASDTEVEGALAAEVENDNKEKVTKYFVPGTVTIESVQLLDKAGNEIKAAATEEKKDDTTKTDDKKDTTTKTDDKKTDDKKTDANAKTGDATSVAALAFVALVAMGGAVVVSKKRV